MHAFIHWLIHACRYRLLLHQILGGGLKQSHTNLLHNTHPRLTNMNVYQLLLMWKAAFQSAITYFWSESFKESFTWISAINSSLLIACFSVTSMPFSCRIVLQHGSTLSLIKTLFIASGAMTSKSHKLHELNQTSVLMLRCVFSSCVLNSAPHTSRHPLKSFLPEVTQLMW